LKSSEVVFREMKKDPPGQVVSWIFFLCSRSIAVNTIKPGGVETENEEVEIVELTRHQMLSTSFKDSKSIMAVQWAKINPAS